MQRFLGVVSIILWSGLALAFVAVGAPGIRRGAITHGSQPFGAYHSTDSFLRFTTGAPVQSERLIAFFTAVPAAKPVLIVISKADPRSLLLGMVTAYLAAPHPVRLASSGPEVRNALASSQDAGALIFCRVTRPDSIPAGRTFGEMEICPTPLAP